VLQNQLKPAIRHIHQIWHPEILTSFGPLNDALRGRHFRPDGEVMVTVHDWLAQQPKDFFCRGIYALVERLRR
jgi:hypothetical protein